MSRILFLTPRFAPHVGGAETYAAAIAAGLADHGHDVLVVTDAASGPAPAVNHGLSRLAGYLDQLHDEKSRWEQLAFGLLPELAEVLRGWGQPEVVIANSLETTVVGRMVADDVGAVLVGAYHEHSPQDEPFGQGRLKTVYGRLQPDLVLAGSTFFQDRALRFLPPDRVRLIHHGVDTDTFQPGVDGGRTRERYADPAELLVVSVGQLHPRKGQLDLVQAVSLLGDRHRVRLVLAGGVGAGAGEYASHLTDEIVRHGLSDRVVVDARIGHDDMPTLLAAADVAAQPAHEEGLGLAILEAMSSGRAVLTCPVSGVTEIMTEPDLAVLTPPAQPRSLAAALDELLGDPARRKVLGERARAHVVRHFSYQAMVAATEEAVSDLLSRSKVAWALSATR